MSAFTDGFISIYGIIVTEATKADSPYDLTKQFIEDEVNNLNITEKEKAEIMANLMAQVTMGITQQAMIVALQAKVAEDKTAAEVANIEAVTATEGKKLEVMDADKAYKTAQKTSLEQSIIDNQKIKFLDANGNMIGVLGAGGLVPPEKLFENFFTVSNQLLGTSLSVTGSDYTIEST